MGSRLPLRACLSHTLRLSKVSQFYRILLLSISVCVRSYPILSVPNTYTSTPLNMTHLPPSLSPPAQLPFLPSLTHASSALVNTGGVSSSASAATSLASESCFWLEVVDEELGIVAQREPLIIPFSVAVMMSVGVWYKAGF